MPLACVTGATAGIGAALAAALARRGHDLLLVARDADRLDHRARELTDGHQITATALPADLTDLAALAALEDRLSDSPVDLLVNNAGLGTVGRFWEAPLAGEQHQVDLHVRATLRLTRAALPGMVARGHGAVVNVASVAGLVPGASSPTYGATKAFQIVFSENLAVQLRGTGVRAMALCPGFTRTEFHDRGGMDVSALPKLSWLSADRVAEDALHDLDRGRVVSVPSRRYRTAVALADLLPRPVVRRLATVATSGRRPGAH